MCSCLCLFAGLIVIVYVIIVSTGAEKRNDKSKAPTVSSPSSYATSGKMLHGKVVTFHNGMGSIIAASGASFFFYATDVHEPELHSNHKITVGDKVKFEASENRKGLLAKRLIFLK